MNQDFTILLIEDDEDACKRFSNYIDTLEDISLVSMTKSSYEALQLVQENLPDAIILDLELNYGAGNGLLFLQQLHELSLPHKPFILITTNNPSTTIHEYARQLKADFIMLKYQNDYSEKNAIDFLHMLRPTIMQHQMQERNSTDVTENSVEHKKRLNRLITLELNQIGINPKSIGYQYLLSAIALIISDSSCHVSKVIAEENGKTNASVERAMQNAISRAWRNSDIDDLLKYYTARIDSSRGEPTYTEFIHYYATKIKNM